MPTFTVKVPQTISQAHFHDWSLVRTEGNFTSVEYLDIHFDIWSSKKTHWILVPKIRELSQGYFEISRYNEGAPLKCKDVNICDTMLDLSELIDLVILLFPTGFILLILKSVFANPKIGSWIKKKNYLNVRSFAWANISVTK